MYHPAAALHQGNLRPVLEEDMWKLRELLQSMQAEVPQEDVGEVITEPKQLKML